MGKPARSATATVIHGTGAPGRVTDVRIVDDRITAIGTLRPQPGETVIDGRGLILAPGFIDSHSHHDRGLAAQRDARATIQTAHKVSVGIRKVG